MRRLKSEVADVPDGGVIVQNNDPLSYLDISKYVMSQRPTPTNRIMDQSITSIATTNTLYNIDEDKEVENSFKPTENIQNTTNVVSNQSSTSNLDDSSDSDSDESFGPPKVMLRIKPKSEVDEEAEKKKNSTEVLKEISKSLQLKPFGIQQPNTNTSSRIAKNWPYYYTYGSTASAMASNRSCATPIPTSLNHSMNNHSSHFNRSASVGCVIAPNNRSLSDLDLSKSAIPQRSQGPTPLNQSIASTSATTTTLYNIEEDKEVETSVNTSQNQKPSRQHSGLLLKLRQISSILGN